MLNSNPWVVERNLAQVSWEFSIFFEPSFWSRFICEYPEMTRRVPKRGPPKRAPRNLLAQLRKLSRSGKMLVYVPSTSWALFRPKRGIKNQKGYIAKKGPKKKQSKTLFCVFKTKFCVFKTKFCVFKTKFCHHHAILGNCWYISYYPKWLGHHHAILGAPFSGLAEPFSGSLKPGGFLDLSSIDRN